MMHSEYVSIIIHVLLSVFFKPVNMVYNYIEYVYNSFSSCELTKDGAFELADVLRANSTIKELQYVSVTIMIWKAFFYRYVYSQIVSIQHRI